MTHWSELDKGTEFIIIINKKYGQCNSLCFNSQFTKKKSTYSTDIDLWFFFSIDNKNKIPLNIVNRIPYFFISIKIFFLMSILFKLNVKFIQLSVNVWISVCNIFFFCSLFTVIVDITGNYIQLSRTSLDDDWFKSTDFEVVLNIYLVKSETAGQNLT